MSKEQNPIHDSNLFTRSIKLESETEDDSSYEISVELNHHHNQDYQSSTSTHVPVSLSSAYKGKVEVTSKGRRKIFDGIRWQILCRRPDCRKQTNKKSLCVTHYKEEYESNPRSFQVPSYQPRYLHENSQTRTENEDQNNTTSTTNSTDSDELFSFLPNVHRSIHEGQIKCLPNNRRFLFKNSKWQLLCKFDRTCRNIVQMDSLCTKHYQLIQQKKRNVSKLINNHRSSFSTKRPKTNNDFLIPSSSITEQFDINSDENSYTLATYTSKLPDHQDVTSATTNLTCAQLTSEYQTDQSVQTDLTIPLCCFIHSDDHVFYSICQTHKSTPSILSCHRKSEPQIFENNSST